MFLRLILVAVVAISSSTAHGQQTHNSKDKIISRILVKLRQHAPGPKALVAESVEKLRAANPCVTQKEWDDFTASLADVMFEAMFAKGKPLEVEYRKRLDTISSEGLAEVEKIIGLPAYQQYVSVISDPDLAVVFMQELFKAVPLFAARLEEVAQIHKISVPSK